MADQISVPDSGAGSGSSTATFGEGIGQIFAMPVSGQVDTSAAESDSGVDVLPPPVRGVRRMAPGDESWGGSRSPARVPPRHGISSNPSSRSPSSRRPPQQNSPGSVPVGPRGRLDVRSPSVPVSGSYGRLPNGVSSSASPGGFSPTFRQSPSIATIVVDGPSIAGGAGYTPTRLDTPFTPTRIDTPAVSPGAMPTPNGIPDGHHGSMPVLSPYLQGSQRIEPQSLAATQYYSSPTSPVGGRRELMDDSQAAKRAIEPSSLPLPAVSRARTVSPTTRVPEPLSYFPEHASPSSRLVAAPLVGSVEIFRPVLLPRSEDPPERRLNISMTVTEYEGLVSSLQDRFQQARTLGQEQGVQAMNEVVNQLVNLVERMYREGRELQQQYDRLEATLVNERSLVVQWLERTKLELQKEAQEFVESHRQSLQRQFEEERSKLTISFEHEREEARAEYLRQVTLQGQVAARQLDETKRTLAK